MSFSAGEMVRLKSGGPNMAIERIFIEDNIEYVWCVWFETTKKADSFATVLLEPAAPKQPEVAS